MVDARNVLDTASSRAAGWMMRGLGTGATAVEAAERAPHLFLVHDDLALAVLIDAVVRRCRARGRGYGFVTGAVGPLAPGCER